jgi:hypothetical protein
MEQINGGEIALIAEVRTPYLYLILWGRLNGSASRPTVKPVVRGMCVGLQMR